MNRKELLLKRLNDLGSTLSKRKDALALLGLGSVGIELERLDEYSDLDFFVIVKENKQEYIDNLDWLNDTYPLAYAFRNSDDGYKIMFDDAIYGEFAIFTMEELHTADYPKGRVVWSRETIDLEPKCTYPQLKKDDIDYAIGEALTNIYVGLGRYARGEKLSAQRFIQNYAVDRIISIIHHLETEVNYYPDPYGNERRIEKRYPQFAKQLPSMILGYDKSVESAESILNFLKNIKPLNQKMVQEIEDLILRLK